MLGSEIVEISKLRISQDVQVQCFASGLSLGHFFLYGYLSK